jgi:Fe-S oxidoreductase
MAKQRALEALSLPLVDNAIPEEAVWQCTTCGWCVEGCPVLIEHVDTIVEIRRNLVLEESRFPRELAGAFRNMETAGNPWGQPRAARLDWAKGLDVAILGQADGHPGETAHETDGAATSDHASAPEGVLYWVGCAGAFDERNRKVVRAMAALLRQAGIPFSVLGSGETCTGDPARRAGNEYLFQMLAEENVATLTAAHDEHGIRTIVASCPHCFNTIKNEYPQFGLRGVEVIHHTQLLETLVAEGRLKPMFGVSHRAIAYHDACYLGRYNDIYDPGRRVIEGVPGNEVVEMDLNHRKGMLWRRRCADVDGGARRPPDQPRSDRAGAEYRGGRHCDRLPVLPGHAPRRDDRP